MTQVNEAQTILGSMLADAINGFPVPFYPRCLQKAHENAALWTSISIFSRTSSTMALRNALGEQASMLDVFRLQTPTRTTSLRIKENNMAEIQIFPREQDRWYFPGLPGRRPGIPRRPCLPYRNEFQNIPMHGQFLLVQLETPE